jgi:rhodanese-related sulfurtransferase
MSESTTGKTSNRYFIGTEGNDNTTGQEKGKGQMKRLLSVMRDDVLWAGYLLLLAVLFGLSYQWPLVKIAWRGELTPYLDKIREQRRVVEFKGVPTLSLEEAHDLWKQGQALFLDARSPEEFAELHIPKAVNLPPEKLSDLENTGILGFPRDRRIVIYCAKIQCNSAFKVARHLQSLGFSQVMAFLGGFQAWDEAGHEVDTSY